MSDEELLRSQRKDTVTLEELQAELRMRCRQHSHMFGQWNEVRDSHWEADLDGTLPRLGYDPRAQHYIVFLRQCFVCNYLQRRVSTYRLNTIVRTEIDRWIFE